MTANHFTGEVFEHTLGSIPINMTVKDLDKVRRKKKITKKGNILELKREVFKVTLIISLEFSQISKTQLVLEGADKDVFSVEPQVTMSDSIVQLLVKQPQKVDFEEKQQMVLEVSQIRSRP